MTLEVGFLTPFGISNAWCLAVTVSQVPQDEALGA